MTLDGNILIWIQENIRNSFLSSILIPYTSSGNFGILWICVIIFLFIFKKTRKAAALTLISFLLATLLNEVIIKNVICRPRPFEKIPELIPLVKKPTSWSCPSGHSATAFACALTIFLNAKKAVSIPFITLAIIMGFSRMYVGVHYPSDVLAGFALGCTSALAVSFTAKSILKYKSGRAVHLQNKK